jgi:capsular polysaccharide biosynthesis protein
MPSTSQPKTDLNVILERLQFIQETICKIDRAFENLVNRFNDSQLTYTKSHERLSSNLEDTKKRTDKNELDIRELRTQVTSLAESVKPLVMTNRILTWLAEIIGSGIVVFIGALLTHAITVVFH